MISIFKKSFFIVAAAVLLISVYFIAGVLIYTNNQYNDINRQNLEEAARTLKSFTPAEVFTDPDAALDWASRIGESTTDAAAASYHRITLINRGGQVIFDTQADSSVMENHLDRQEFQAALRSGFGFDRRQSATLGQYHLYGAVPIYHPSASANTGELAGVLRVSRLVTGFYTRLISSTLLFFIGGLIVILGACGGLYFFSRSLSLSVEQRLDAELKEKTAELKIKAEEAEAESRHREVIINSIYDGLVSLDSDLNIIHVNPRLCSLFGINFNPEEARGMSLLEFSRSKELEEAARQVLLTGQPCELSIRRYVSGTEQIFQAYAAPMEPGASSPGTSRSLIIVLGDISRLVKLEQVRKDFAANVSHELRTPIQVIQGFAENLLNSSMDNKEEIGYFAGIIKKNAEAMENLTNDLLTLVSLEDKNTVRSPMEFCELAPLVDEAIGMVEIAAKNKNIKIETLCPPELTANLHSSLFIQALVNLLDNSIKYSEADSWVRVNVYQEGDKMIIEVKDRGIGIPSGHLDRIFERFYRVDQARRRADVKKIGSPGFGANSESGTGLGLSIVRHIALLHQGTVEVESHAGEGSVFRIKLPVGK